MHGLACYRMGKAQRFSVQAKPVASRQGVFVGIKIIAEYGMAEMGHVNAQLMCAPGFRGQSQPGVIVLDIKNLPVSDGAFAVLMIDHLFGPVGPIGDQGLINPT